VEDIGMSPADAAEKAGDVIIWEGDRGQSRERLLGDYASEFFEETGGLESVPESVRNYIDWEAMGRDWDLGGDISTFEHDRTIYIICNPLEF
jgi:Antirestriction protein